MERAKSWACVALATATCAVGCTGERADQSRVELGEQRAALSGREGKLEYAIDAPWRLEPVGFPGNYAHGAVPITISIHDAHQIFDDNSYTSIGNFLSLEITETSGDVTTSRSVSFDELREVEATFGAWQLTGRPEHVLCEPVSEQCTEVRSLAGTSAWHATYWYTPEGGARAGDDIELAVEVRVEAGLNFAVPKPGYENSIDLDDHFEWHSGPGTLRLKDHLKVHLGEAPLPRFGAGWLYGDLHYHSQNTDNEGEAGYAYRGTVRAMGSLGLDFAFATEHASNSRQITDLDLDLSPVERDALRDMSPERFRFALESLHGPRGANLAVLDNPGGSPPQTARVHAVAPQLYLGGEVDAIPEVSSAQSSVVTFGNGLTTDIADFCTDYVDVCLLHDLLRPSPYGGLGVVGLAAAQPEFTRQHIVYMPQDSADQEGFVASDSGPYGGGGRWFPDVLEDIEAHGVAFLAHPLAAPVTAITDFGPDMFPYTDFQLARAFASPAILGLQLWNEDPRLKTEIGANQSYNSGQFSRSDFPWGTETGTQRGLCNVTEDEELECLIELEPRWKQADFQWERSSTPTFYAEDTDFAMPGNARGMYSDLHHGTFMLDQQLKHGLDPARTAALPWLPQGEPRRTFLAAGSDAHGDLNYRREGYFFGTKEVHSTAMGTPRNLVYAGAVRATPPSVGEPNGAPDLSRGSIALPARSMGLAAGPVAKNPGVGDIDLPEGGDQNSTPPGPVTVRYPQAQVVDALKTGNFSVTDGPALRILIDRNRNGVIDDADVPMGGILNLYEGQQTLPLLVEWQSTPEFGPVANIDIYLGSVRGEVARIYAPVDHGVRVPRDPQSTPKQVLQHWDGQEHVLMADNYFKDPTGQLRIELPTFGGERSYGGVRAIDLDLTRFPVSTSVQEGEGTGFFVRAFAKTEPEQWQECMGYDRELFHRVGRCFERLAYTNPVWAVRREKPAGCPADPRAIDRDGDQLPDHCDICSDAAGPVCINPGFDDSDDWSDRFGGSLLDEAQAVAIDDLGSVFVAGNFQSNVVQGNQTFVSEGNYDGFVAKYSREGALEWTKHIGGAGDMRIMDIDVDVHGNPVIVGWYNGSMRVDTTQWTATGDDTFVISLHGRHFEKKPLVRWSKQLSGPGRTAGLAVTVAPDDHVWVGGSYEGSFYSGSGGEGQGGAGSDCYAARLGSLGQHDLTIPIKGAGNCELTGLAADGEDLLIAGRYTGEVVLHLGGATGKHTNQVGYNGFVARYREGRFYTWSAFLGDSAGTCTSGDAQVTGIDMGPGGHVYASGYASGCLGVKAGTSSTTLASSLPNTQPFVVHVSPEGSVSTGANLGVAGLGNLFSRFAYDIAVESDGGYVVTGTVATVPNNIPNRAAPLRVWVARYSYTGALLWIEELGETGQSAGLACDVDDDGYVAVAGRFGGSVTFGDADPIVSAGGLDAFAALLAP